MVFQVFVIGSLLISIYAFHGIFGSGIDVGVKLATKVKGKFGRKKVMFIDVCVVICLVVVFFVLVICLLINISITWKSYIAAVLAAGLGACLRGRLYRCQIQKYNLPLGTFAANLIGNVLVAFVHIVLSRFPAQCCASDPCWLFVIAYAVTEGFCASLTTVSILISEIHHLKKSNKSFSYVYIIFSVLIWQFVSGIINGINFVSLPTNTTLLVNLTQTKEC